LDHAASIGRTIGATSGRSAVLLGRPVLLVDSFLESWGVGRHRVPASTRNAAKAEVERLEQELLALKAAAVKWHRR
jgi:hypothetical protein